MPVVEEPVQPRDLVTDCRDLASVGQLENLALLEVGRAAVAILLAIFPSLKTYSVEPSFSASACCVACGRASRAKAGAVAVAAASAMVRVNRVAFMIEPFVMQ